MTVSKDLHAVILRGIFASVFSKVGEDDFVSRWEDISPALRAKWIVAGDSIANVSNLKTVRELEGRIATMEEAHKKHGLA